MKTSTIIIVLVLSIIGVIVFFSVPSGISDEEYAAVLAQERLEKDQFMKESSESPFLHGKSTFASLEYFEPARKYVIKAKLLPIEDPKVVQLPTSSGEVTSYLEYGWAAFELDGAENRLLLLESMAVGPARGTLFLAFADATSGRESYGGGRYLEVAKIHGARTILLDFNRAYNPYCAYSGRYSCPLPPQENTLKIEIRAGEKDFHSFFKP